MQTVNLKLIVEKLTDCGDFANQYGEFKKEASIDLQYKYDKLMSGLCDCYEALDMVIGTIEVNNIKNR